MTETKTPPVGDPADLRLAQHPSGADAHGRDGLSYPPIAELGVVGDRRSAAVINSDGVVQWFCLPAYDGIPIFGRLLDRERGGYWRLGPACGDAGSHAYVEGTNVLVTHWQSGDGELELTDAMPWPGETRPAADEGRRTLLRRLRCRRGSVRCSMQLAPRDNFGGAPMVSPVPGGWELRVAGQALGLWTSRPVELTAEGARASFALAEGEEFWAALGIGDKPAGWNPEACGEALEATIRYWREWS